MEQIVHIHFSEIGNVHKLLNYSKRIVTLHDARIWDETQAIAKQKNKHPKQREDLVLTMCGIMAIRHDTRKRGTDDVTCPLCLVEEDRQGYNDAVERENCSYTRGA